jgi:deazaflavin-dependent oxidoreductase (nitroreductase family)
MAFNVDYHFGTDAIGESCSSLCALGAPRRERFTVPRQLRYVDPTRPPTVISRSYAALAATRFARVISRHVNWKLDPVLLRLTGGRLATTLVFPTALLETRGANTGELRRHAIIYFHDADRVIIIASNAGDARHPAWYHNLIAHPDVTFGGFPMRANPVTDDDERVRLWPLADQVFPAFATYRSHAAETGRTIPIIELKRIEHG